MSCFQVSPEHINAMLNAYRWNQRGQHYDLIVYCGTGSVTLGGWHDDAAWTQAAKLLWEQNARSCRARYADADGVWDLDWRDELYRDPGPTRALAPVAILKACDCYDYQSCETDDYDASVAKALVRQIRQAMIGSLPGYQDAAWEVTDARFAPCVREVQP